MPERARPFLAGARRGADPGPAPGPRIEIGNPCSARRRAVGLARSTSESQLTSLKDVCKSSVQPSPINHFQGLAIFSIFELWSIAEQREAKHLWSHKERKNSRKTRVYWLEHAPGL